MPRIETPLRSFIRQQGSAACGGENSDEVMNNIGFQTQLNDIKRRLDTVENNRDFSIQIQDQAVISFNYHGNSSSDVIYYGSAPDSGTITKLNILRNPYCDTTYQGVTVKVFGGLNYGEPRATYHYALSSNYYSNNIVVTIPVSSGDWLEVVATLGARDVRDPAYDTKAITEQQATDAHNQKQARDNGDPLDPLAFWAVSATIDLPAKVVTAS